ncbi:hypothetical protein ACHAWF_004571, partial [Thalassiosira exigua]
PTKPTLCLYWQQLHSLILRSSLTSYRTSSPSSALTPTTAAAPHRMMATETETVSSLRERVAALERSSWNATVDASGAAPEISPALRRARRHVQESGCHSSEFRHCPPNYYELSLGQRMGFLGAHSTSQLCKACLFENKNYKPDDAGGGKVGTSSATTNARYYLVVVQYVESIDTKRLSSELRGLRPPGPTRFGPSYFGDMRLAPEEVSERLTGYGHNGVSPFGMLDRSIPVVICKSILNVRPKWIWMGGGHKDWKLGMAVSEFVRGVDGIVLNVSEPRTL